MAANENGQFPEVASVIANGSRKRKHEDDEDQKEVVKEQATALPQQPDLPEFNLTRRGSKDAGSQHHDHKGAEGADSEGWQMVEGRPRKKKKIPKNDSKNYPAIIFSSDSRLQSQIKISDLQQLVLYILADGTSPSFVAVRHRPEIRKVVVLMVPGLEMSMFRSKTLEGDSRSDEIRDSNGDRGRPDSRDQTYEDQDNRERDRRDRGGRNRDHRDRDSDRRDRRARDDRDRSYGSPDDYFPNKLKAEKLPEALQPFADMFDLIWPVKTPGDEKYGKMHSPLHAILTAPAPKAKEEKYNSRKGATPAKELHGWKNTRVPVSEFVHTPEELLENDYTLHPVSYDEEEGKANLANFRRKHKVSTDDGWVDTMVQHLSDGTAPHSEIQSGSITAGRDLFAMDCEMCVTGKQENGRDELSLTRISIVGWDGSVVLDELVKPEKPIINYVTQYSGITEAMIAPVTTTLADIQKKLVSMLHPRAILIGHSLNSDMNALRLTHPFIIDTALIYPHPRGPPLKSSLKWLAQKYLNREIQKGHGTTGPGAGHDSIEDARTCLDLLKQKCEKGKQWGTNEAQGENIFKRVARAGIKYKSQGGSAIPSPLNGKSSAAIDWGDPRKGPGAASTFPIGCHSDEEVMEGVIRAIKGDPDGKEIPGGGVDFVWGRFRELEAVKGWWNNNKFVAAEAAAAIDAEMEASKMETDTASADTVAVPENDKPKASEAPVTVDTLLPSLSSNEASLGTTTAELTRRIAKIYEELPPCTAFMVYSGSGDPREMSRLQAMQSTFKKEYRFKKWDELSVKWTDTEEQALKRAFKVARDGVAFFGVK
ncbi:related to ribonuclease H [Rhynchosporium agropyri]|uniref:Related to ribonuclease H n=1 Tax=Rhynchosporium agropyri TaxID=914238 RepID=A0A1E1KR27_9HELO|nr:related to ribonuclease H [Rhynchosporium agropyri]